MDKFLNQFLVVADEGSITRAAEVLLMTQPTLTSNMQRLEKTVGAPLFTRSSRGVQLTKYGVTLYHNTTLMRRLYDNTLEAIANQIGADRDSLRIGSGYSWWSLFLRDMTLEHDRNHPDAPIFVSIGDQLRCMDQLLSGDISCFLAHEIPGLSASTGTEFMPFGEVGQGFYVRKDHPLTQAPCTLEQIEAHPRMAMTVPEARHQRFLEAWSPLTVTGIQKVQGNFAFASNSLAACLDYVRGTDAVFMHSEVMESELCRRGIVRLEVAERANISRVGVYVLQERRQEPRVADLIERIVERAKIALAG